MIKRFISNRLIEPYLNRVIQQSLTELIPLLLEPTLEELLLKDYYDTMDDFWNDSFSFTIEGTGGRTETRTYPYRDLVSNLDDFDSIQELNDFLEKEQRAVRRHLIGVQAHLCMMGG